MSCRSPYKIQPLSHDSLASYAHECQAGKWCVCAALWQANVVHSHLYSTSKALVSTFQRVELPIIPALDQYRYVLYSDTDVFFRKRITMNDFGGYLGSGSRVSVGRISRVDGCCF